MTRRVAVVGGGLAGVTAALDCADADREVVLYESRRALGGLTHSFRRGGLAVDNGQHVFLRCCTAYLSLLRRLGVADGVTLQPRLSIPVRRPGHCAVSWLRRGDLPAPLHLAASLLRYRPLSAAERVRFAMAAAALRRVDAGDPETDRQSFGGWLRRHGQSEHAIATLWDVVGIATLNARADAASLALAATVFQDGLLTDPAAADIGWSLLPLGQLHGEPAARALAEAGARVRTGTPVRGLHAGPDGWRVAVDPDDAAGTDADSGFDAVVLAVPPVTAERLLPPDSVSIPAGWSHRLGSTPIVNAHLVLDRPVLAEPFVAAVDSDLQWVFDRTGPSGLACGQYLAVSLSAADDLMGVSTRSLRDWLMPRLTALLPDLRAARPREFFVTRERNATFRQAPGSGALRPGTGTRADGLFLAGAWTATGWPATMEGAVRSGAAAASAVLHRSRTPTREGVVAS